MCDVDVVYGDLQPGAVRSIRGSPGETMPEPSVASQLLPGNRTSTEVKSFMCPSHPSIYKDGHESVFICVYCSSLFPSQELRRTALHGESKRQVFHGTKVM